MNILEERSKNDKILKREIINLLIESFSEDSDNISVTVFDSNVLLEGTVESEDKRLRIELIVSRYSDVNDVTNDINVF